MVYWGKDKKKEQDLNTRLDAVNESITEIKADIAELENNYIVSKEISLDNLTETLYGTLYMYSFDYDISGWDNTTYQLESITLKNIHKQGLNKAPEVDNALKKAISSVVFDDNKLYGNFITNAKFDNSTSTAKADVVCFYKKVMK